MQYFIDIGNTRIKYTIGQQPFRIHAIAHENLSTLLQTLSGSSVKHLLIVSGRSTQAQHSLLAIEKLAGQCRMTVTKVKVDNSLLKINYSDTSQFGCDRFLNLLAAKDRFQQSFCVVSCGTAITLDFYTNKHIGGMILPGLGLSKQLLTEKAALTGIKKTTQLLGNDTASSIGAGLYFGYQNLISKSIERLEENLSLSFTVGFTGGDAEVLCLRGMIIPDLLFSGMIIYQNKTTKN